MSGVHIYFDSSPIYYVTGSQISGRIICNFISEKNVRAIKVCLKCEENSDWTERESHYDSNSKQRKLRYIRFTGHTILCSLEEILFHGGEDGRGIRRGSHSYPFIFSLPKDLPSSFDGSYGSIKYTIKAVVDIPMQLDYENEKVFPVVSLIDCNGLGASNPVSYDTDSQICCWCRSSGPITMELKLRKEAFTPGEYIKLQLNVTNLSNANVDGVSITLEQNIKSKVTNPRCKYKNETEQLCGINDTGVGAHGERTYDLSMQIPSYIVVPNFKSSKLFSISYTLKATLELPLCHQDLEISTDIKLGHIKIQDEDYTEEPQTDFNSPPPAYIDSGVNNIASIYSPSAIGFPALPSAAYPPPISVGEIQPSAPAQDIAGPSAPSLSEL